MRLEIFTLENKKMGSIIKKVEKEGKTRNGTQFFSKLFQLPIVHNIEDINQYQQRMKVSN